MNALGNSKKEGKNFHVYNLFFKYQKQIVFPSQLQESLLHCFEKDVKKNLCVRQTECKLKDDGIVTM